MYNEKLNNINILLDNVVVCIKKDSKYRQMKIRSSWIERMRTRARLLRGRISSGFPRSV